jgi:hypothetical protein
VNHLNQPWFKKCKEASEKGIGNIYAFGIKAIREEKDAFYAEGKHKLEKYHFRYEPNPYLHQYDLLVHIWLNYYKILEKEIQILRKLGDSRADDLQETRTLYGIERKEFFFAAAELRWPTTKTAKGAYDGIFVRDPWAEQRIEALSDEHYKYVMTFGGGGQGKTVVFCAFLVMIWEHYIFTEKGARCMFSTVGRDKINSATWPNIQRFIKHAAKGISLYAGKGVIAGDWTIKRPGSKDTAGVIKGILISNKKDDSATDKLTGSHGHHFIFYLIDEIQSTPLAPINASSNFTLRCGDFRIAGAGNYNSDNDSLGLNVVPYPKGWDAVDQNTGKWRSITTNEQNAIVLHFSNERSPGMTPEGEIMFPHLPNQKTLREKFKSPKSRDIKEKPYRRFWLGWRLEDDDGDSVLTSSMVKDNGADLPLQLKSVAHKFLSFDSAQAEGDRNLMGHFQEGVDELTEERVWGLYDIVQKTKTSESLKYYMDSTSEIILYFQKHKIPNGAMILDFTGRPAHAEILMQKGYSTVQLTYNAAVPDGKRKNPQTKRVEKPWLVHEGYDERGEVKVKNRVYAHMITLNRISFGAWLLQEYVKSGRVRGINKTMMDQIHSIHSIDEEMFSRKFRTKNSQIYGELQELVPKEDFKEDFGFSPDLLDIWCQAAYYMFTVRRMPITPIGGVNQNEEFSVKKTEEELEEHNDIWKHDQINYDHGYAGIQDDFQQQDSQVYGDFTF